MIIIDSVPGENFDLIPIPMNLQSFSIILGFNEILLIHLLEVVDSFLASQHWPDGMEEGNIIIKGCL